MECKKCKNIGTVVLRKKDYYCDECFVTNTNHKFRASIGKHKIISKNENVLVCLSGGGGSTVLLQLICNGLSMSSHKKLRITPLFLHILDSNTNNIKTAETVIKHCNNCNVKVFIVHISQYIETDITLPEENSIPTIRSELARQFSSMMNKIPATTVNDFMIKIKRSLYLRVAEKLDCRFVFTGETTKTLAITLLSNLALGRGSQVQDDVGFCDSRHDNIRILRPMKDISAAELDCYINIKNLNFFYVDRKEQTNDSLQSVIGAFVLDLQENFPATISTICKTADKIGVDDKQNLRNKCVLCESEFNTGNFKLTALQATKFSRIVSNQNTKLLKDCANHLEDIERCSVLATETNAQNLCYSCSYINK